VSTTGFALFGARPTFSKPVPFGQRYFPSWERYEEAVRGIFDRQYYTEYGPLNQKLEQQLQQFIGVRHAICVTNATVAMMMLADAMGLKGKVILPSLAHISTAQSLSWAGLEPVFCDVDPVTHQLDPDRVAALINQDVSAIMGVHLSGGACRPKDLAELAERHDIQLYFDAAHAFGCAVGGRRIGTFGRAEVFSFRSDMILNATDGGCICTNDNELAARLRTMRSSAGAGIPVAVTKTVNGRMSEAQCAIALMSLEDFPVNRQNNENLYRIYEERLVGIPGLDLVSPAGVSISNFQSLVCRVDERIFGLPRDVLIALLKAENVDAGRYFHPGQHRSIPFMQQRLPAQLPVTESLCATCMQLPVGAHVTDQSIEGICDILRRAHQAASAISVRYGHMREHT